MVAITGIIVMEMVHVPFPAIARRMAMEHMQMAMEMGNAIAVVILCHMCIAGQRNGAVIVAIIGIIVLEVVHVQFPAIAKRMAMGHMQTVIKMVNVIVVVSLCGNIISHLEVREIM